VLGATAALVVLGTAVPAQAAQEQGIAVPTTTARSADPGPSPADRPTIGVGLMGALGASFLTEPSDQSVMVHGVRGQPVALPDDAGFVGLSGAGGIALELRACPYFGLELDWLRGRDSGTAELSATRLGVTRTFTLEVADVAWHLPLLAKALIPTDAVRPFLLLGPELVVPETAEATVSGDAPAGVEYRARARSHLMVTAGLGAEILLPVAELDLRVPIAVRASTTPAVGSSRDDRARYRGTDLLHISRVDYATRWQYQALVTLGALVHF
jgi:hypothetical protein